MTLSLINGFVFTVCYGFSNYFASLREDHYSFYFSWETSIPFYPGWIYVYLSIFLWFVSPLFLLETHHFKKLSNSFLITTFIATLCFILFPSLSSFDRTSHIYGSHRIFDLVYMLDMPHNLLPSLHVSFVTLFLLIFHHEKVRFIAGLYLWAIALVASVLLTHQHHVLDIVTGILLGTTVFVTFYKSPRRLSA